MDLVLVGQPYSGKSTIFNAVVGYKSVSTNAPGSTSEHAHGALELDGEWHEVIDLPGIYSLQVSEDAGDPAVEHSPCARGHGAGQRDRYPVCPAASSWRCS
jgi:Fe2+ transport system protein B